MVSFNVSIFVSFKVSDFISINVSIFDSFILSSILLSLFFENKEQADNSNILEIIKE